MTQSADPVVRTLNRQFRKAMQELQAKNSQANQRGYEIDYCYVIDAIQRDAICNQQHHINEAKRIIEEVIRRANENTR